MQQPLLLRFRGDGKGTVLFKLLSEVITLCLRLQSAKNKQKIYICFHFFLFSSHYLRSFSFIITSKKKIQTCSHSYHSFSLPFPFIPTPIHSHSHSHSFPLPFQFIPTPCKKKERTTIKSLYTFNV